MKLSFEAWMFAVNQHLDAMFGLSADDLPDCSYSEWYDDGVTTRAAAKRAAKLAGGF